MGLKATLKKKKEAIKRLYKQSKKHKSNFYARKKYIWYWDNCPIDEKLILLEALDGGNPTGNIAAILKELYYNLDYKDYTLCLSGRRNTEKARRAYLDVQGMDRVKLLVADTTEYYKVLATAKYLISEVSFMHVFVKRPEQIYLNTWHGTPLKTLGRKVKDDYATMGNVQKTFFDADYLLCPNEFTMNVFIDDFMLRNFAKTKLLLTGYPRNSIFLDEKRREEIRKECGFEGKQIISFMPTWRGSVSKINGRGQNEQLIAYFNELDTKLNDNQIFYVKLHHMNSSAINLSNYVHIKPFPMQYDGYEFLNASDVLVTDYSSVMFDFAICRQKIVLFTYDKEQYFASRGFYFDLDELPFPQTNTIDELLEELAKPKNYDDTAFLQRFCPYDKEGITKALCRKVFFEESSSLIEERDVPNNGKENVMLYIGAFEKNGITTSALNLLHTLDRTKYNYAIIYRINEVRKNKEQVLNLPQDVAYFGFYAARSSTLLEIAYYMMWREMKMIPFKWVLPTYKKISNRDRHRVFSDMRIDKVVHFNGYSYETTGMIECMPCPRAIYAHNDMEQESKVKGNADWAMLSHIYKTYDVVAAVTEDIIPPIERIAAGQKEKGAHEANIVVCKNVIDYKRVLKLSEQEISFDAKTKLSVPKEQVLSVLDSDAIKFVSMGRFSFEKSHDRLIHSFEKLYEENKEKDMYLIIIGGYGKLYKKTVEMVKQSTCKDRIFLIQYMSNPYALLKKCNAFVLSSLYEGFGLVLAEADIVGIPCFSTDIPGPRTFMQKYGGLLVENNEDGILNGFRAYLEGKLPEKLTIDYEQYNKEAIEQFESLLQ